MRSTSYTRSTQTSSKLPWWWIGIISGIIFLLFLVRSFNGWESSWWEAYLSITPGDQSSVYISMTSASKSRITWEQKLFATDKSVSVETWNALAKNEFMNIDIDKWSELSYKSSTESWNTLELAKWRIWIKDITKNLSIELRNYTVEAPVWSILMAEQNWPYSNVYVLRDSVQITTTVWNSVVSPGYMASILKSDLINPNTNLWEWIKIIEWSIMEYPLFIRNDWASYLGQLWTMTWSISQEISLTGTWTEKNIINNNYIEITEPKAGILSKTETIIVMWNILSKDVKRVTINNTDAVISPVNETFTLQDLKVTSEIFDIVYKAYDSNNSILQTWVITIFWEKWSIQANNPLIPETFEVSPKDFIITSPAWNPYSTTERFIKVQWTIPKNTIDYIMVNDYRLQKFIPKSWNWYYFANMDTGTMKDWLNLYTIKFYKNNWTLIYSQPFTIIKETNNATVSGE